MAADTKGPESLLSFPFPVFELEYMGHLFITGESYIGMG